MPDCAHLKETHSPAVTHFHAIMQTGLTKPAQWTRLLLEAILSAILLLTHMVVAGVCAQVELQGVSLVVLSFFRDLEAATQLADMVKKAGGIMGAAVCCAENGGDPNDDWTTCDRDRDMLLDRSPFSLLAAGMFAYALCAG